MTPEDPLKLSPHEIWSALRHGAEDYKMISRIWEVLGFDTYEQTDGKAIYEIVRERMAELKRLREGAARLRRTADDRRSRTAATRSEIARRVRSEVMAALVRYGEATEAEHNRLVEFARKVAQIEAEMPTRGGCDLDSLNWWQVCDEATNMAADILEAEQ